MIWAILVNTQTHIQTALTGYTISSAHLTSLAQPVELKVIRKLRRRTYATITRRTELITDSDDCM